MPDQEPGQSVDWRTRLIHQVKTGQAAELRERIGMSQTELARRLQADRTSVYRWETGRSTPRDIRVLVRWSNLLIAIESALLMADEPPPLNRPVAQLRTTPQPNPEQARKEAASLPDNSAEGTGDHQR